MANEQKLSRVQKKGQVTIPIEIRDRLGIQEGDLVAFVETEQGVLITRQGIDLDDLIESGRQIRGDLIKERYGLSDEA
jgi:AbrB family looped-hinge helix DNA binding protein